jgi:drug/metabolite transporter (DMT)-like permease
MTRRQAVLALWTTCLIWGFAFPLVKLALADVSPMLFTALRFSVATALLLPALRHATPAEWRAGGWLGLLLASAFCAQTVGLDLTSASRSGFITALYIPFTPLIVAVVFRRLPGTAATAGITLAMIGMWLLTRPGGMQGGLNPGDILCLACAALFAAHMVATGHYARRHPVERLMMTQIATATLASVVATPLLEVPRLSLTPLLAGALAYEAVLASLVAIPLQLAAQRTLSPTYTALVYSLEPVVASLTAMLLIGDRLDGLQWAGGGLILAGTLVPEAVRSLRRRPITPDGDAPDATPAGTDGEW